METDSKLRALMDKFATDLAAIVKKRDAEALTGQLAKLKLLMAGKKAVKDAPKPAETPAVAVDSLVATFNEELVVVLQERDAEVVEGAFERLEQQLLNPAPVQTFRPPKLASPKQAREPGAPHPLAGVGATPKPCPNPGCGTLNVARRYSYLCENHRSDENAAKYRAS